MDVSSGVVELRELIALAAADQGGHSLLHRAGIGRAFGKRVAALVGEVPKGKGVYVWGAWTEGGDWACIYVGKSAAEKHHLHGRVKEELTTERVFLWKTYLTEAELRPICAKHHPRKWPEYFQNWQRALQKAGTTHIIWISTPGISDYDVKRVEGEVIQRLRPRANQQSPQLPRHEITDAVLYHIEQRIAGIAIAPAE